MTKLNQLLLWIVGIVISANMYYSSMSHGLLGICIIGFLLNIIDCVISFAYWLDEK